jgi:hypothetical protein
MGCGSSAAYAVGPDGKPLTDEDRLPAAMAKRGYNKQKQGELPSGVRGVRWGLMAEIRQYASDRAARLASLRVRRTPSMASRGEEMPAALEDADEDPKEYIRRLMVGNAFFNALEFQDIEAVVQCWEERRYEPGWVLLQQGNANDTFFMMANGTVEVFVGEKQVATFGKGHIFGELSLMNGTPCAATIKVCFPSIRVCFEVCLLVCFTPLSI